MMINEVDDYIVIVMEDEVGINIVTEMEDEVIDSNIVDGILM